MMNHHHRNKQRKQKQAKAAMSFILIVPNLKMTWTTMRCSKKQLLTWL
jgi:hypothetical protein